MTQNKSEIERSINCAERTLMFDQLEIGQHVSRMNFLYDRRNKLTAQLKRDRKRIDELEQESIGTHQRLSLKEP